MPSSTISQGVLMKIKWDDTHESILTSRLQVANSNYSCVFFDLHEKENLKLNQLPTFYNQENLPKNQDFHSSWKIKWSGHGVQTQCLHLYMAKTGWCWITAVPLKWGKKSSACHSPLQSLLIPNMEVEYPLSCFILYLPWMLSAWSTWAHVDLQSSFRFYFCFWLQLSNGLIDHQSTY